MLCSIENYNPHTLVSGYRQARVFVDSINSEQEVNELLKNYDMSSNEFNLTRYSDNIVKRREFVKAGNSGIKPEGFRTFFNHYWLYSYEAIPYAKLLTKIGLDVRVFNFKRPNHWISSLAEKPNMLMFFVTLITPVFCFVTAEIIRALSEWS
jgi:hypothetical protein